MFVAHGEAYLRCGRTSEAQRRAIRAISTCRTAVLGGHLDVCAQCGDERPSYNSCRNRHCPKCQSLSQARWIEARQAAILPVPHFHVVFTLPASLRPVARADPRAIYALLLRTAARVLLDFGRDERWLGAELGVTTVLHTWTRDLSHHPHAHCIVSGGGLSDDGNRWVEPSGLKNDFLFPTAALAKVFRARFVAALRATADELRWPGTLADEGSRSRRLDRLFETRWVVYCKRSFAGAEHVYRYLGRYTHRVGLSNQRMVAVDERGVTFRTRGDRTCTVSPIEFVRRFLMHVLPRGFVKIRHYGLFANGRTDRREVARALLTGATPEPAADRIPGPPPMARDDTECQQLFERLTGIRLRLCRCCGNGIIERRPLPRMPGTARGPPHLVIRPTAAAGS